MSSLIGNSWDDILHKEYDKEYFINLMKEINNEYHNYKVYPNYQDIFNSLKYTPIEEVKVVILGQDPYYTPNYAHGFAFSVPHGVMIPKSLQNIFLEINYDIGSFNPTHGNLLSWARQGVLLLNTVMTVRDGEPGSHKNLGWELFTDRVIEEIDKKNDPVVFLFWGNFAKSKNKLIKNNKHLVLTTVHPSPLSAYRGFFGCKHFSKTNEFLIANKINPIDWIIR